MFLTRDEVLALSGEDCERLHANSDVVIVPLEPADKDFLADAESLARRSGDPAGCMALDSSRLLEKSLLTVPILTVDFLPKTLVLYPTLLGKNFFSKILQHSGNDYFYSSPALQADYQGAFELVFRHSLYYHHAQISNTDFCNLRCRGCAYHGNDPNYGFAAMRNKTDRMEMEDGVYYKYIEQLPAGKDVLFCPSGEMFMSKKAMEYVGYACRRGLHVRIVTNGMLLTPKICNELVSLGVKATIFSIDGHRADLVEKIRLGVDFQTVLSNLRCLIDVRDSAASPMSIGITSGWFEELRPHRDEIVDYWKEFGVDTFAFFEEKLGLFSDARLRSIENTPLTMSLPCFKTLVTAPLLTNGVIAPCSHHMPISWSKFDTSWMKSIHDNSIDEIHRYYRHMRLDPQSPYRKNCARCESKFYCYMDHEGKSVSLDAYRFTNRRTAGEAAFVKDVSNEEGKGAANGLRKFLRRLGSMLKRH